MYNYTQEYMSKLDNLVKEEAIKLRRKGRSLNEISATLKIAKSTASLWLRNLDLPVSILEKLYKNPHSREVIEKRRISRIMNEAKKRQVVIDAAEKEIVSLSLNDLRNIGIALYWAEGLKRGKRIVSFSNSDPNMIKVMMRFFREICKVPEIKFRGHIHVHSGANTEKAEKYWSEISSIPRKQFFKTYAKNSIASNGVMKTLPFGTFDIYVFDSNLYLKIMGWIGKVQRLADLKNAKSIGPHSL